MARSLSTRGRFFAAYLVLGLAVGTGIGTFIVLLERDGPTPPPPWSSWVPSTETTAGRADQIATHVGDAYRLPSGSRLTRVVVGAPGSGQGNLTAIAIPKILQPRTVDDYTIYDPRKSLMYVLCGPGKGCKITEGKPSVARGTVLRREALELALYSFEYSGVENVIVFFPPGKGEKGPTSALFLRRGDLSRQLDQPLRQTLSNRPPLPGAIKPREEQTVNDLTGARLFRYTLQDLQGGGRVLVLEPVV